MAETGCRHFNGYKPCGKAQTCDAFCASRDIPEISILIIHLGALGAVLRSTALLPAIKRKYPSSHITWITDRPADQLLKFNPLVDRVLNSDLDGVLELSAQQFDVAFCIDKALKAAGLLAQTRAGQVFGFRADPKTGAILPATEAATELWSIGISDELKFFKNTKTENQLVHEALELGSYEKDEYQVFLSPDEDRALAYKLQRWSRPGESLIGLNTGCSPKGIPYKRLSVDFQRELIQEIQRQKLGRVVLLGGPEDRQRNSEIAQGLAVIESATDQGIRDGLSSVAACDVVVTGDSLGMHMAIGLRKPVVAWFGPTCAHEIELYGRGQKILSQAPCGPCWKRLCQREAMCYDQVALSDLIAAIKGYSRATKNSSCSDSLHW